MALGLSLSCADLSVRCIAMPLWIIIIMNEMRKRVATGKGYKYVGCRVSSESTTHLLQSVFF